MMYCTAVLTHNVSRGAPACYFLSLPQPRCVWCVHVIIAHARFLQSRHSPSPRHYRISLPFRSVPRAATRLSRLERRRVERRKGEFSRATRLYTPRQHQCTYACTEFFSRWQRNSIAVLPSAVKPKILRWRFRDCHCELSCVILSEGRAGKRFVALRESHKVQTQTPPSMFGCGEVNE